MCVILRPRWCVGPSPSVSRAAHARRHPGLPSSPASVGDQRASLCVVATEVGPSGSSVMPRFLLLVQAMVAIVPARPADQHAQRRAGALVIKHTKMLRKSHPDPGAF